MKQYLLFMSFLVTVLACEEEISSSNVFLNIHNALRSCHGAHEVIWNERLESKAAMNANTCVFEHTQYGENICMGFATVYDCIMAWYNESVLYRYYENEPVPFNTQWGHFTQIVWNQTTSIGCAIRQDCPNGAIIFCLYDPPGNVIGQFSKNVFKPEYCM